MSVVDDILRALLATDLLLEEASRPLPAPPALPRESRETVRPAKEAVS